MTFAEETSVYPVSSASVAHPLRGGRGSHPRGAGRLSFARHRFGGQVDDSAVNDSPANARLARLHHRAMRLERRMQQRQERRHNHQRDQQTKCPKKTAEKTTSNVPHEVHEDGENYRLRLVVPGYGPSSLTVMVGPFGHVLRVHGKKTTGLAKSKENYEDNHFKTAFKTKGKFDTSKLPHGAKAVLSNGILHISIPKDPAFGQATPVAVSEAVFVPAVAVAAAGAETDVGFELVDDEFVKVSKASATTASTPLVPASSTKITSDDDECADGEECVEEDMDDDNDEDEIEQAQLDDDKKPRSGSNNKMFRRQVEVPGVRLEDLTVEHECEGRILRVIGIRRAGGVTGFKKERTFSKKIRLRHQQIDVSNLSATLDHGVLCITAPRTNHLGGKKKGGRKTKLTHQEDTAAGRFFIPVTTIDGIEGEDDIVAGFESIDLAKSETTAKAHAGDV